MQTPIILHACMPAFENAEGGLYDSPRLMGDAVGGGGVPGTEGIGMAGGQRAGGVGFGGAHGYSSGAAVERVRALAAEEMNRLRGELSAEAQDLRRVVEDQSQQVREQNMCCTVLCCAVLCRGCAFCT